MKNLLAYFPVMIILIIISSCNEIDPELNENGKVEFYSLEYFEMVGNTPQIDENTVGLKDAPLITYEDLISYNAKDYSFSFTENGKSTVKNMQHSLQGVAIAIVANAQPQ